MRCIELGSFGNKQKLKIAGFFASLPFLIYLCNKRLKLSVHCERKVTQIVLVLSEGCPIHPTRVDSSLVFAIGLTGSRFVRDLENITSRVYTGWVENVVDSTRFDRIDTNRFPCCRFVIPEFDLQGT